MVIVQLLCDNFLTIISLVLILYIFFDKNKRYSFIQIDRVHQYNTNSNSLKTKRMKL